MQNIAPHCSHQETMEGIMAKTVFIVICVCVCLYLFAYACACGFLLCLCVCVCACVWLCVSSSAYTGINPFPVHTHLILTDAVFMHGVFNKCKQHIFT